MEYTWVSIGMLLLAVGLNLALNPAFTKRKKAATMALSVAFVAQLLFDNLTVARGFWHFNDAATLGFRIPFMPVENLFFGMTLFLATIAAWELLSNHRWK